MLQVNLLLGLAGRPPDSFVMLETTVATLWLATVLGLCFGGGQHGLGLAGLALGLLVLWVLKWLEVRIRQERRAS
jgi:putative Mg2+ transporter-C (MgtC) family protein